MDNKLKKEPENADVVEEAKQAKADLTDFEKLRDEAGDPPSDFSNKIFRFEAECPSKGPGVARNQFTFYTSSEAHEAKSRNA